MPRSSKSGKTADGLGSIRKKTVIRKGQRYEYWEARYTSPDTGKQHSLTAKTQKEVAQKLREKLGEIASGSFIEPNKITVSQWTDTWQKEYLLVNSVKPSTITSYEAAIRNHIVPSLGKIKLYQLTTMDVQKFINSLQNPTESRSALSPKTIKNVYGLLHHILAQAVLCKLIIANPADACVLPKVRKKKIKPMNEYQIAEFVKAIQGHKYESMMLVALFTGMREGEVCGLEWSCVDFGNGTILVDKQLQSLRGKVRGDKEKYALVPTKNGKERTITAAPFVMDLLWKTKQVQNSNRKVLGKAFHNTDLVFTDSLGYRVTPQALYRAFKLIMEELNMNEVRFHDLRHSYAVIALKSGDDVKTIQENLGHATASFTLDTYGHVTEKMKKDSADRMEAFIQSVR